MSEKHPDEDRKRLILKWFTEKGGDLTRTPADSQIFYFLINMVINDDGFFTGWVVKQNMEDQSNIIFEYINNNFMDRAGKPKDKPLISERNEDIFDVMMKTELERIKGGEVNDNYASMVEKISENQQKLKGVFSSADKGESKVMSKSKDYTQERDVLRTNFEDYVISIFAYISRIYSRDGAKEGGGKIQRGGSKLLAYIVGVFACFMTYCQISTWMSLHVSRQARAFEWKIEEFKGNLDKHFPEMLSAVDATTKNVLIGCEDTTLKSSKAKADKKQESSKQLTKADTPPNQVLVEFFEQGTETIVLSTVLSDFEKSLKCLGKNITKAVSTDIYNWGQDIGKSVTDSPEHEQRGPFEYWFEKFTQIYSAFENPKSAANQVILNVATDGSTIILKATEKGFALDHMTKEGIGLVNQLTKVGVNGIVQAISYARWMLFVEHIGWNLFSAGMEEYAVNRRTSSLTVAGGRGRTTRLLTNDAPFAARYGVYFGPRSTIAAFLFQVGWRSSRHAWQTHIEPGILNLYRGLYFSQPPPDDLDDFSTDHVPAIKRQTSPGVDVSIATPAAATTSTALTTAAASSATPSAPDVSATTASSALVVQKPSFSKKAVISEDDMNTPSDLLGGKKTRKKRRKKNKTKHKRSKRRKSLKKRRKKKRTRKH
jgi:hypothetical protein